MEDMKEYGVKKGIGGQCKEENDRKRGRLEK